MANHISTWFGGVAYLVTGKKPKIWTTEGTVEFGSPQSYEIAKASSEAIGKEVLYAASGEIIGEGVRVYRVIRQAGKVHAVAAAEVQAAEAAVEGALKSFDDIVTNPKSLWGKSADEIESMLGEGWTKGAYGSKGTGWKFTKGDQSIFYHPGGGVHRGSYYGFSSGKLGKNKIVGLDYKPLPGDKATIISIGN
ncbi:MAG TPA: hypothetical protein VIM75_23910 [Ohtaekwangia sp.]|uniref:hypothetical protein n=1 Tax=Ohtaekwangia sp. TaxID=2066019 RepID=UPI002F951972